jgi:hypothetical protein
MTKASIGYVTNRVTPGSDAPTLPAGASIVAVSAPAPGAGGGGGSAPAEQEVGGGGTQADPVVTPVARQKRLVW